jgi:YgiT-type zinc finger domain-containing protein
MFLSKCPLCDSPNIHQTEGSVERKIHGEFIIVPSVRYWICPDCGEKIFLTVAMRSMNDYIKQKLEKVEIVEYT